MIMRQWYLDDLKEHIRRTPSALFAQADTSAEAILADEDVLERLWGLYQKSIEDYDCDAEFSYRDALNEVLGIPFSGAL